MSVCSNKQEETTMEHTSTIRNMIDKPKHLKYDFIHNRRTCYNEDADLECSTDGQEDRQ
jgi:hypothetical protein